MQWKRDAESLSLTLQQVLSRSPCETGLGSEIKRPWDHTLVCAHRIVQHECCKFTVVGSQMSPNGGHKVW